jgi:hypothetical protein
MRAAYDAVIEQINWRTRRILDDLLQSHLAGAVRLKLKRGNHTSKTEAQQCRIKAFKSAGALANPTGKQEPDGKQ